MGEIIPEVKYHRFLGKYLTTSDRSQEIFGGSKYAGYVAKYVKKLKNTNFNRMIQIYKDVVIGDMVYELTSKSKMLFQVQTSSFLSKTRLQNYLGHQLPGTSPAELRSALRTITPSQLMKVYALAQARKFWKSHSSQPEALSEWFSEVPGAEELHRVDLV